MLGRNLPCIIQLPYPPKCLWPNGRAHWAAKGKATRLAKKAAYALVKNKLAGNVYIGPKNLQLTYCVNPKLRGKYPDKDNTSAAMKAYQDGIAQALGIDDGTFETPIIEFGSRLLYGGVTVSF